MPAVPVPAFAISRPALDLVSMHGELEACSVPVNVDSASIEDDAQFKRQACDKLLAKNF
jgi:hypothetical protein